MEQRAIWVGGTNGYNTYRIPALLTTLQGTVLAFCEGRVSDPGDQGAIHMPG
jgi:sialidase-1